MLWEVYANSPPIPAIDSVVFLSDISRISKASLLNRRYRRCACGFLCPSAYWDLSTSLWGAVCTRWRERGKAASMISHGIMLFAASWVCFWLGGSSMYLSVWGLLTQAYGVGKGTSLGRRYIRLRLFTLPLFFRSNNVAASCTSKPPEIWRD